MSKAFTKEDEGVGLPALFVPRRDSGTPRCVTPEGYAEMVSALATLQRELAESSQPPEDVRRRASSLNETLSNLVVVSPSAKNPEQVSFGAWVTVEKEDGSKVEYRIVGPDEADVRTARLSMESPLAQALLGKRPGDVATVERPKGTAEYTLLSVRRG